MNYLTDFERDQLIEVINIGAGNASTALSKLIGRKIQLQVPEIFIDRVEKVPGFFGESEQIATAVLLKISGDAPGIMLLLFSQETSVSLVRLIIKKEAEALDEFDRSALREIGNILSGSSLNALSKFLDLDIRQSVPDDVTDMLGAVIDSILAEIGMKSDIVLTFRVNFRVAEESINGRLFFLFDPQATQRILAKTREKMSAYAQNN